MGSLIKTADEIAVMREGGAILVQAIEQVLNGIEPGVTTKELDDIFSQFVRDAGAEASFLGYRDYPASLCVSINSEVVHGIPGERQIASGDIVSVDGGVRYKGFCTDMARTKAAGDTTPETQKLIDTARQALKTGTEEVKPGNRTGDIGSAIQELVEAEGYSVVRVLVGHGVGKSVHEEPAIPNFGKRGSGTKLKVGMVLALEPMVNIGGSDVVFHDDGWTVTTADDTLSAHFEDTIAVTESGYEILTPFNSSK